ncbi:MAG: TetR/AcrR family transcriptional regulator [Chloroflexi bacterium]|nr:TetR/AcrR family transcriptional regulator [Chloroflexota bacterium]
MMSSKKQRTRAKILEAARRLLEQRGYYGVGLEEVAREASISRRTLYLHFESKADLLVATVHYLDETVGTPKILRQAHSAATALESLDEWVAAYGRIEPQIYDIAKVIYAARQSDQAAEASWQDRMAFRRKQVKQVIKRLKEEGLLEKGWTVDRATDFVWALLSVHTYEYLVIERGWSIKRFVSHLRTVLRRTIVKEPDNQTR